MIAGRGRLANSDVRDGGVGSLRIVMMMQLPPANQSALYVEVCYLLPKLDHRSCQGDSIAR
jgi:hypothetical protein